jgi:hypothetical protein
MGSSPIHPTVMHLHYHRVRRTFVFAFEGTARSFASFLQRQGVPYVWSLTLGLAFPNQIKIL